MSKVEKEIREIARKEKIKGMDAQRMKKLLYMKKELAQNLEMNREMRSKWENNETRYIMDDEIDFISTELDKISTFQPEINRIEQEELVTLLSRTAYYWTMPYGSVTTEIEQMYG